MIEYLGFLYSLCKDIKKFFISKYKYKDDVKTVDDEYVKKFILKDKDPGNYLHFSWCYEDKIEIKKADGYDYHYSFDEKEKKRFIFKNKDGLYLIVKKVCPHKNIYTKNNEH